VRYRFLGGGQGLLPPAQLGEPVAQVVKAHGQGREEGLGMLLGQLAVVCYRFLGGGQGLLPPATRRA
jgi:hypothetical protein